MSWQPLSTAPRDGTIVDLWCALGWRITDAKWSMHEAGWIVRRVKNDPAFDEPVLSGFLTHWMLPPEPPQIEG